MRMSLWLVRRWKVQLHPFKTKLKKSLGTPSAAVHRGMLASAQEEAACSPPTREGGSEVQEVQKPTAEAGRTHIGGG